MKGFDREQFVAWLESKGCHVLRPTNPHELTRWRGDGNTGVIYTGKKGVSFNNNYAAHAFECFVNNRPWDGVSEPNRKMVRKKEALVKRDGLECFYCGNIFEFNELTHEHMLPRALGGNNSMENLALACVECNSKAGHKPIREKIVFRDRMRQTKL